MSFLQCGKFRLSLDRPLIMGVVNVTPDSFSDGGRYATTDHAVAHARSLIEQGADMLISAGAMQSNHCRQTAAAAAKFGFKCILVLTGQKPEQASANFLLDRLFDARIVMVEDRKDRDRILQETFDKAKADGNKPYLVPYGGSSPTGALGYAFAMEELMRQLPCEDSQPSQG